MNGCTYWLHWPAAGSQHTRTYSCLLKLSTTRGSRVFAPCVLDRPQAHDIHLNSRISSRQVPPCSAKPARLSGRSLEVLRTQLRRRLCGWALMVPTTNTVSFWTLAQHRRTITERPVCPPASRDWYVAPVRSAQQQRGPCIVACAKLHICPVIVRIYYPESDPDGQRLNPSVSRRSFALCRGDDRPHQCTSMEANMQP